MLVEFEVFRISNIERGQGERKDECVRMRTL